MQTPITDFSSETFEAVAPGISRRLVLYGCGVHGGQVLAKLRLAGLEPVAFCDADAGKWGRVRDGVPVLSPGEAGKQYGDDGLFIVAIARYGTDPEALSRDIEKPLAGCGVRRVAYVPDVHETLGRLDCRERGIDVAAPVLDLGDNVRMPNFFLDPDWAIRDSFGFVLSEYFFGKDGKNASEAYGEPYDRDDGGGLRPGDTVVDCGANLGIFSAHAAAKGCLVHAFEPVPQTAAGLEATAKLYPGRVIPHRLAVGAGKGTVGFTTANNALIGNHRLDGPASEADSAVMVDIVDLDGFIADNDIPRVDFIKADIEGEERHMLRGAAGILRKFAPRLAICSYHLPDDPEVIAAVIHDANPRYAIRHVNNMIYARVEE